MTDRDDDLKVDAAHLVRKVVELERPSGLTTALSNSNSTSAAKVTFSATGLGFSGSGLGFGLSGAGLGGGAGFTGGGGGGVGAGGVRAWARASEVRWRSRQPRRPL